jgi:hypothetical protein
MRKIETQTDKDKKKKRNNLIVGLIMVVLIGLSSLGYAIMSRTDSTSTQPVKYGNLEFVKNNDMWITTINSKVYYFYNLPTDVENISIEGTYSLGDYSDKTAYFVNANQAAQTLDETLKSIVIRSQDACLQNATCANNELPIKDCSNNVFIFDASKTETKVYKKDNCIFLEGNSFLAVDKLIYRFFNIA